MEEEKIKEKALLTDKEITELITEEERRNGVPEAFIRAEFDLNYHKAVAQAQVDKFLKTDGVELRAENQDLPRDFCQDVIDRIGPTREDAGSYKRAQQDMLTPDSEGNVWVKCRKKEEK